MTLFGGDLYDKCYFSGNSQPQCVDAFGAGFTFPEKLDPTGVFDFPVVYNCDPNGMTGLIPATINTIRALRCACPPGQEINSNGVCSAIECLNGQRLVTTNRGSHCFSNDSADISADCLAAGWTNDRGTIIKVGELGCDIPVRLYSMSSGFSSSDFCTIAGIDRFIQCTDIFGDPPQFPNAAGDDGRTFVANCSRDGTIPGTIPATINTIGAKDCTCDSDSGFVGTWPNCACPTGATLTANVCTCPSGQGFLDNGSCGTCPPGQEAVDNVCSVPTALINLCEGAGWGFSTSENSCGILLTLAGGAASDKCYLSGSTSPKCADVFASTVHYFPSPTLAADGATLRFVYNCDLDGESGLIPATANTIAATECGCESGASVFSDVCISDDGDLGLSDELLCGAFGGTVRTATGGREVCSGMDANDTFCIMDSAVGFPCRGLFKHLRSCNVQFNRKALNPFFLRGELRGAKGGGVRVQIEARSGTPRRQWRFWRALPGQPAPAD